MVSLLKMSGRGQVGNKTGGKGSWRRKAKRVAKGGNQEGQKVWFAASRLGCRDIGEIDFAAFLFTNSEAEKNNEALYMPKPHLAFNLNASTFVLNGPSEKKNVAEVLTQLISGFDFSKMKDKQENQDDLGDVPADVDFSKPEGEEAPAEENKEEAKEEAPEAQ